MSFNQLFCGQRLQGAEVGIDVAIRDGKELSLHAVFQSARGLAHSKTWRNNPWLGNSWTVLNYLGQLVPGKDDTGLGNARNDGFEGDAFGNLLQEIAFEGGTGQRIRAPYLERENCPGVTHQGHGTTSHLLCLGMVGRYLQHDGANAVDFGSFADPNGD